MLDQSNIPYDIPTTKKSNTINIGVGIFVVDSNFEKILIGKRKDCDKFAQPGGWCEFTEEWEECGSRELFEETNINIPKERFIHIKTVNGYDKINNFHNVVVELLVEVNHEEIKEMKNMEPNKCEGWFWADYDFIERNMDKLFFPMRTFINITNFKNISDFKDML